MAIQKSGEEGFVNPGPFTIRNDTDRWNAVAVAVFLMAMAVVALVTLALPAARSW